MPFSEDQLETWSGQGAITSSSSTYTSIKTCIDEVSWNNDISYEMYLQGSYKNSTNIRGNSDVDVVIEFQSIFFSNKEKLKPEELTDFNETHESGKYTLGSFKAAVLKKLIEYYGAQNVKDGNKSLKVVGQNGRLNADVICCASYREYKSYRKTKRNDYREGIKYFTLQGNEIINFPKLHYTYGVSKNQACNNYKPVTRIIKNMKARMVAANTMNDKVAPSYFIECLLYNAPDNTFNANQYSQIVPNVLNYLDQAIANGTASQFVCQNYQRWLFGTSDQQWQIEKCKEFVNRIIAFWNAG